MLLKYLSRVSVLTILAVGVVACSSSGNNFSNPSTSLPPSTEQTEAEKAEAERLQNIETNRVALLAKAKTAGLTDQQAAAYAEANKEASETDAQSALNTLVAEKAEADRIAAEKAEADRIAAEKAAAEKAEADRIAAEKAAAEKAEADRIAAEKAAAEKAEADRIAAEKAEADRIAAEKAAAEKAEADRIAAEKAEADRIAAEKAAAEKAAAEKAEADRIAAEKAAAEKAEAERLQRIEVNRVALLSKAKTAGLTDQQAATYAEANKEASETDAQSALNTIIAANEQEALRIEVAQAKGIPENTYPVGAITANTRAASSSIRNALTQESRTQSVVYNQPYSVVLGDYSGQISYNNQTGAIITDNRESNISIKGLKTTLDAIPMLGSATYKGKAFNGTYQNSFNSSTFETTNSIKEGVLSYNVNFTNRTGSGSITGLGDTVDLQQGSISGTGINSTAQQGFKNGSYLLDFYGKKAEEVAGKVVFNGKDTIGFGGTRGEISGK